MSILDSIIPIQLPYPIRGGIIRGVRTAVAMILAGVAASIADGSIIKEITIIPAAYTPAVLIALSTAFVSIDKWLRERGLVAEANEAAKNSPLTDELPADTSVVKVPAPAVNVNPDPTPFDPTENSPLTEVPEIETADDPVIFDDPTDDHA